jgi:hypothetical protein
MDAAGKPTGLLDDCGRTGIRNFGRAGVSEKVAMTIGGHEPREIFDRYDIVNETDLLNDS